MVHLHYPRIANLIRYAEDWLRVVPLEPMWQMNRRTRRTLMVVAAVLIVLVPWLSFLPLEGSAGGRAAAARV